MEGDIQELINAIEQSEKNQEVLDWMKDISQPEFGLIDSLINTFVEQIEKDKTSKDAKKSNQIMRAIRKLNEWVPGVVMDQMKSNEKFPLAIRDYCVNTEISQKSGDGYVLLVEIFEKQNFKPIINEDFVKILIHDIQYLDNEGVLNQLILILVHISYDIQAENSDQNMVIEQIKQQQQSQPTISESLALIVNEANEKHIVACLHFIDDIFKYQLNEFFFSKDLKIVIGMMIKQIQEQSREDFRQKYMDTAIVILKSDWYKENKHLKEDLLDMCQQISLLTQNSVILSKSSEIRQILQQL